MYQAILTILQNTSLCKGMTAESVDELLHNNHCEISSYQKGERVFDATDKPTKVYILLQGSLVIARDTFMGRRMIVAGIDKPGELFGEIYAFMELEQYDMYAEAQEPTMVLGLDRAIFREEKNVDQETINLLRDHLLTIFATKAYTMNRKIKILGSSSIREKIVKFLMQECHGKDLVQLTMSREKWADYLNVTRPSLSRELGNMAQEGMIALQGKQIRILDAATLEDYL